MSEGVRLMAGLVATLASAGAVGYLGKALFDLYCEKGLSAGELAVMGVLLVGLWGTMIATWGQPVGYGLLFVLLAVGPLTPIVRRKLARRDRARFEDEEIRKCRELLEFDPKNGAAYLRLAELYEQQERYDEAIDALHTAIQLQVADAGATYRLNKLLAKKRRTELGLVMCWNCGAEHPRSTKVCPNCGKYLSRGTKRN